MASNRRHSILLVSVLVAIVAISFFGQRWYFDSLTSNGSSVAAGLFYESQLGDALRTNNLVQLNREDYRLKSRSACQAARNLKALPGHDKTLHFTARVNVARNIRVRLHHRDSAKFTEREFFIHGGEKDYSFGFADAKQIDQIEFYTFDDFEVKIGNVWIDGYFTPRIPLLIPGNFDRAHVEHSTSVFINTNKDFPHVKLTGAQPRFTITVPAEANSYHWHHAIFANTRKHAYCDFEVAPAATTPATATIAPTSILPKIEIIVDEEDLNGPDGLITNPTAHGDNTEKPAIIHTDFGTKSSESLAGLRFHGGGPGRKKGLVSYRIYFHDDNTHAWDLFGRGARARLKTLVLKYTQQTNAYFIEDKNPFAHAMSVDIGAAVGAIVPRQRLVQLYVNGDFKGVFLAMDHFSSRTLDTWVKNKYRTSFTYKKDNLEAAKQLTFYLYGNIILETGEAALAKAEQYLDIDNVINSAFLSSYIGDDDYCQGVDYIAGNSDDTYRMAIINWDLDHGMYNIWPGRVTLPLWQLPAYLPYQNFQQEACPRQWAMAHLFRESKTFRDRVVTRHKELFDGVLSQQALQALLEPYRRINQALDNRYATGIAEIEHYIRYRETYLTDVLVRLTEDPHTIVRASSSDPQPATTPSSTTP